MSDLRLLDESALTFRITDYLAFVTSGSVAFDNMPPTDVDKLDWALSQGLTISLESKADTKENLNEEVRR